MKLIDKDTLVAEIERLDEFYHHSKDVGGQAFIEDLLSFLDTLETKEVDLEKSISDWLFEGLPNDEEKIDYIKETAKHFFELGITVSNKQIEEKDI